MQKITFGLLTGAAILAATALAYAQSASPIEGNPSAVRPAPPVSGTVVMPGSPSTPAPLRIPLLRRLTGPPICPAATPIGLLVPPKPTSHRPDSWPDQRRLQWSRYARGISFKARLKKKKKKKKN